ncbi:Meiosis induction protein kinase IME2/SME1 [Penicillium chermesinum]|uniref:Meiosis induction protein kinase IME2/SME1 n=1 Tax=Penicillium chermesinum TaxID=63820 RepID=A0A9W9TKJ9_9EURO|nr:Meiosis induction protein kinase IME2/SME1 [Penicillium chermesinum]KAJ5225994.1 Meiosis induction protein kinase IME2/SME1 [Penicillium chermesinum]
MTITYETPARGAPASMATLEDRFQVMKEVGDGSFGSVAVARVRTAGAHIARRGRWYGSYDVVAIKTMKKSFDSLAPCLELREVIFLRTLPVHPHLVPALDIFLDPMSRKLHIAMEYMDGNLYQLMKSRDHKYFEGKHVKSILYQILAGLDHIHAHHFFHRDIKPENILVSTSAPNDSTFSRYSNLVTPPSTPPTYTVKIADFGLARETQSKQPYTTYVSTRWYRAPEVLLRAGEYSAPVDMWAVGAMAVEIATLKPLFPGGNEVDQVWRVCEIMGSPGNWYSKSGARIGGGEWREGSRLAHKLGFTFPKMAPHSMDSVLNPQHWPAALADFVTWCLMWDPKNRPTCPQALNHEYFVDAVDPLRPKSSTSSRLLGRKQSEKSFKSPTLTPSDSPTLSSKPSWFRRSMIGRSESPVPNETSPARPPGRHIQHRSRNPACQGSPSKHQASYMDKRYDQRGSDAHSSLHPTCLSLSNSVTAQANATVAHGETKAEADAKASKKIGQIAQWLWQHYPTTKESFFSHLRKRARRLSGRNQAAAPPDDIEANAGCIPWSNRSSMALDGSGMAADGKQAHSDLSDLDKALNSVKYTLDSSTKGNVPVQLPAGSDNIITKRQSMPGTTSNPGPISSRTRRAMQMTGHPVHRYETPEEEDELLDEVLHSASRAARRLALTQSMAAPSPNVTQRLTDNSRALPSPYPTPSPTAKCDGYFDNIPTTTPVKQTKADPNSNRQWPTPPYEESEWNNKNFI